MRDSQDLNQVLTHGVLFHMKIKIFKVTFIP